MTTTASGQRPILDEVKHRSGWAAFMGLLTVALGIVLLMYPLAAATATTLFVGCILTLVGAVEIFLAFASQTPGNFFLRLLLAVLYGFTGIVLIVNPFAGAASLTLFVGWMLVLRGILAMVAAFQIRPLEGWGWFVADSLANLAAGVLIIAKWPSSTVWAVGTLVGVSVLVTGISQTIVAVQIRRAAGDAGRLTKASA
ncbi:MAG TPA: HdeD family acid-resistance protein [Myxococcaceae bacterium]|nr:HdeD family acid-resistance protein [Myxococcaceae bacterium]